MKSKVVGTLFDMYEAQEITFIIKVFGVAKRYRYLGFVSRHWNHKPSKCNVIRFYIKDYPETILLKKKVKKK
jgi:hypothetical protein